MSPIQKARHVSPGVAKERLAVTKHVGGQAQSQLASLLVGGIALVTAGLALVLVVRDKI
jgi:hypothetical protein